MTFDEISAEDFFRPGITSVVQPTFDMGYRAVEVLLNRIENGDETPFQKVRLPAMIKVRESSGTGIQAEPNAPAANRSRTALKRQRAER